MSDNADPLLIPEFKVEILEEIEEATPIQDLNEVYEQQNGLIDQEIKEEFNLGE